MRVYSFLVRNEGWRTNYTVEAKNKEEAIEKAMKWFARGNVIKSSFRWIG